MVLAVTGATAVVTSVAANAQQAGDGTLTLTPATGTHLTVATLDTSGPCPTGTATSYVVEVDGPGTFDGTITGNDTAGLSFTDPFRTEFRLSMDGLSQVVGLPIVSGRYDIALRCTDDFDQEFRRFTTAMFFTSPTAYSTDPNASPSATSTTLDPPAPAPTDTVAGPSSGAAQGPPGQVDPERNDATGQGVLWLVLAGAVLVFLVVIVVLSRMRKRPSS